MSNYLYTVTNRQTANAVAGMKILPDGTLQPIKGSPFATGGKGSPSSQSQNGIWIAEDLVYAVDFGSESFAIFRKDAEGSLSRLNDQPIPSGGNSPCSICVSDGKLYLVNQGVRSSGTKAEPSLAVFKVKGTTVRPLPDAGFMLRRGESPTQAIVNRQGTLLAVPSVRARVSLMHIYRINAGAASGKGLLQELESSPFTITDTGYGFGSVWAGDGKTLFMTNAIGAGSVLRLQVNERSGQITETARATTPGNACWSALGKGGKRLYVANLLSLIVFDVSGKQLTQMQSVDVTDVAKPVLRDLILRPDGKFLYALEQRVRRILVYAVDKDGRVALHSEQRIGVSGYTLGLAIG
jgi:hypothetical protein